MHVGPGDELARQVRGHAVAAAVVALAIGAHGVAGGGMPRGVTLSLLTGIAAVLAAAVVAVPALATRRSVLVPVLATGQVLAHGALALGDAHGGPHTGPQLTAPMLLAHAAAVVVCAALIAAAERIGPRACAALRRILPLLLAAWPVPRERVLPRPVTDVRPSVPAICVGSIARRGPPAFG